MNKPQSFNQYIQVFGTNYYDIRARYPMAFAIKVTNGHASGLVRKSDLPKQERQA